MRDEEYIKRMENWYEKEPAPFLFNEGEEVEVFDANLIFNDTDLTGQPFPEFIKEAAKHFGEKVEVEGKSGILIGISYTYLDWYYLIKNNEHTWAETCISKIKFLENLDN